MVGGGRWIVDGEWTVGGGWAVDGEWTVGGGWVDGWWVVGSGRVVDGGRRWRWTVNSGQRWTVDGGANFLHYLSTNLPWLIHTKHAPY